MADNAALVQEAYDGFAKGDVGPLVAILDDDVEWNEAEHSIHPGSPFRGTQAVLEGVIGPLARDFEGFRIDVGRISVAGDTVFVEARYRATAKATGMPLDALAAHVWDFRNGKVVKFQQYTDTWQWTHVTGIEPKQ